MMNLKTLKNAIEVCEMTNGRANSSNLSHPCFDGSNLDISLGEEDGGNFHGRHFIYHIDNISDLFDSPLFNIILNSDVLFSDTHIIYSINEKPFDKNYLNQYKAIIHRYVELKNKKLPNQESSYEISKLFDIILKIYEFQEDKEILDMIDSFLLVPIDIYHDLFKNFERTF